MELTFSDIDIFCRQSKSPHFCHFRTFSDTVVVPFWTFSEIGLYHRVTMLGNSRKFSDTLTALHTTTFLPSQQHFHGLLNPQQPSGDYCLQLRSTTLRTHFFSSLRVTAIPRIFFFTPPDFDSLIKPSDQNETPVQRIRRWIHIPFTRSTKGSSINGVTQWVILDVLVYNNNIDAITTTLTTTTFCLHNNIPMVC